MADHKLTDPAIPDAGPISATDNFYVVQAGVSTRGTGAQLTTFINAAGVAAAAVATHEAAGDPHPQYLTAAEGDTLFLTPAEGNAAYDALGAATAAVAAHEAAGNPHPVYLTQAEADALYAALVHATRHQAGGADPIKLDDLAAPDNNTDLNASLTAHGLMQIYPGGTTNFLRADGTFAAPPGGSGTFAVTQVEVDFGTTPVESAIFTITDAGMTTAKHVIASLAYEAPTGKDLDELEMDTLSIVCGNGTGQFDMFIRSTDGSYLADKFKINYSYA
jgi:hypothetical protein